MAREEVFVREIHRMDTVLVIVSLIVWTVILVWSIYTVLESGIVGINIVFLVG